MRERERAKKKKKGKKAFFRCRLFHFFRRSGRSPLRFLSLSLEFVLPRVPFSKMSAPPLRQPSPAGEAVFSVDDPAFSTDEFRMFRVRSENEREETKDSLALLESVGGGSQSVSFFSSFAPSSRRERASLPEFSGASPSSTVCCRIKQGEEATKLEPWRSRGGRARVWRSRPACLLPLLAFFFLRGEFDLRLVPHFPRPSPGRPSLCPIPSSSTATRTAASQIGERGARAVTEKASAGGAKVES